MGSKTEKLNRLFEKWKESYGEEREDFAEDGIVCEEKWETARRKILFLMKETNEFNRDLRHLIREKKDWNVLGYWAYGLLHATVDYIPPYKEAEKEQKCGEALPLLSSAVMNLKKLKGGSSADMEKIKEATERDKKRIKEELRIIKPEIVVCCGTWYVVKKTLLAEEEYSSIGTLERCYRYEDAVWIDFVHPGARLRHDMMYLGLVTYYIDALCSLGMRETEL